LLICFTGIDGSGKTTLAKTLARELAGEGYKSKYTWCGWLKFQSPLLAPFAAVGRKLLFRRTVSDPEFNLDTSGKWANGSLYWYLVMCDYVISTWLRVSIPLMRGQTTMVCDRYAYDLLAAAVVTQVSNYKSLQRALLNLLPKPDLTFLIDLPVEVAFQRKKHPTIPVLRRLKNIYLALAKEHGMCILDGSKDLEELKAIIKSQALELPKRA